MQRWLSDNEKKIIEEYNRMFPSRSLSITQKIENETIVKIVNLLQKSLMNGKPVSFSNPLLYIRMVD